MTRGEAIPLALDPIFVHIIVLISQIRRKSPAQGTQEVAELRLKSRSAQHLASSSLV